MTTATRAARAARDAAEAAREVVSDTNRLSSFRIQRFGRHKDGFFHAEVTLNGGRAYVHCKHGSWLHPVDGPTDNRYREVLSPYRDALSERMRAFERAERRAEEAQSKTSPKPTPQPEGG